MSPRLTVHYQHFSTLPRRLRRLLQRRFGRSLVGAALLCALGHGHALAATIHVTGACTLVDAITAANTDAIAGGCSAGSSADTIVLEAGSTHTLTVENNATYGGPTGLPVVTSEITIEGNGSTITRDSSAPAFRLMAVHASGSVTLQETTVSGGIASGAPFTDNGGGILILYGSLTLIDSTISGNSANHEGGGVCNVRGFLTLIGSTIAGNSASFRGGGLSIFRGSAIVTNSAVSGNSARSGGGIKNSGYLTLVNSTISDNTAAINGGGIYDYQGGSLTLTNSIVSRNMADFNGGGIAEYAGFLTLRNSTVSGNSSGSSGGGIATGWYSTLEVTQCTISGNTAVTQGGGISSGYRSTANLARSLIAGNTAPTGPEVSNRLPSTVTVNQFNLFGVNGNPGVMGFSPKPKDIVPTRGVLLSDILTPLADNTGPTMTHALVPGSPAVDKAGPQCPPPDTDQRGIPRPQKTACDIGAFEFASRPPATCDSCLDTDGNGKIDLLNGNCAVKPLTSLRGALSLEPDPQKDDVSLHTTFSSAGVSLDPPTEGVTLSFVQNGDLLACIHLPAGEGWQADKKGDRWVFKEQQDDKGPAKEVATVQCHTVKRTCTIQASVEDVQLGSAIAGEIMTTVVIGDDKLIKTQAWDARAQGKRLITK